MKIRDPLTSSVSVRDSMVALRAEIEACDAQLVDVLIRRFGWVKQIGRLKDEANLPILDSTRKQERQDFFSRALSSVASNSFAARIYELIHSESVRVQTDEPDEHGGSPLFDPFEELLGKVCFAQSTAEVALDFKTSVLIYDENLERVVDSFSAFRKKFVHSIGVAAGEDLKSLKMFDNVLSSLPTALSGLRTTLVAAGGGSVSDFVGFLSSVYKRGVGFEVIPSTWLSAIDSAHGGKNALNYAQAKNQLGTIYCPKRVWVCKNLLNKNSNEQFLDALGEWLKMNWVDESTPLPGQAEEDFWLHLSQLIRAKRKVVASDLYDKTGVRRVLNLGHTLGHVLESSLGISHGRSVLYGLLFAVRWSVFRGYLPDQELKSNRWEEFFSRVPDGEKRAYESIKMSAKAAERFLVQDKKRVESRTLDFVFLAGFGRAFCSTITIEEMLEEMNRQGLLG